MNLRIPTSKPHKVKVHEPFKGMRIILEINDKRFKIEIDERACDACDIDEDDGDGCPLISTVGWECDTTDIQYVLKRIN